MRELRALRLVQRLSLEGAVRWGRRLFAGAAGWGSFPARRLALEHLPAGAAVGVPADERLPARPWGPAGALRAVYPGRAGPCRSPWGAEGGLLTYRTRFPPESG